MNNVKKIISSLLVAVIILTAAPLSGFVGLKLNFDWLDFSTKSSAEEKELAPTGQCGENVYWTFDKSTGLLTISGSGKMSNYGYSKSPFCNTSITKVVIEDGITSIGNSAFYGCAGLTSITIPDSVTRIGEYTFSGCVGLKELTMPCSAEISRDSFSKCSNIEKVTLTKGTGKMNDFNTNPLNSNYYAYTPWYISKDNMKEIILEDGIISIGNSAFYDCTGLTSITIPDSVTSIGDFAFDNCSGLTRVNITDMAAWCNISFSYDYYSFSCASNPLCYANNLYLNNELVTNLVIPDSVTSIGNYTFMNCTSITGITLPDSVTSIGECAFCGCTGLTGITIPDSVTSIGSSAFSYCSGLTSVTLPDSITSIGEYAFYGCTSLTGITIPDSVTSISSRAFYDCKTIYYNAKNAITDSSAFHSAEKIIVGDTVQTIPNDFARGCDNIKSIIIASSVVKVGNDAFNHCDNLESVTFMGDNRIEMGSNIFEYCNKLKIHCKDNSFIAAYAEMNNLTYSIIDDDGNPEYDIKNGMILSYNGNDKNLFVSSGTKIGFGAFENNSVITDVELSSIVTKIYNKAFANCTNLSKIIIPQSVASIGDNAFEGCDKLTIWCYAGSYAEAYAINHDIPVKYINLQLNENSIKLNTNESVNLCASFNTELSDEIELIWTSDNPSVVTVTSDGRITAVGKGKATITATSSTGLYATCVVNVDTVEQEKPRVNSVKIDDISLNYKKSTTLKPTIKADDGAKYKVEYSTSNAKIATVDKNGKVTATKRGSGTATITCTVTDEFGNTVTDTCKVNVKLSFGQILITYVLFGWIWY